MKIIIIITGIILFSALLSIKSFAQYSHSRHKEHSNTNEHQIHSGVSCHKENEDHSSHKRENQSTKYSHSANIKPNVYAEYFQLKDAFVRSDFEAIKLEIQAIEKSENSNKNKQLAKEIYSAKNIDAARIVLSTISDEYIALAKKAKADLYIIHCSMALNNKGANWLSIDKEVKNPYFGNNMLTCGSVVEKTNE